MTRTRLAILTAVGAAAVAVPVFLHHAEEPARISAAPAARISAGTTIARIAPIPNTEQVIVDVPVSQGATKSPSFSEEFKFASDYLDFGRSLLARANRGNADAQYYLFAALDYCKNNYRSYFLKRDGSFRTLDEALAHAVRRQPVLTEAEARNVYAHCQRLSTGEGKDLGDREDWLRKAAAAGQPMALVRSTESVLLHSPPGSTEWYESVEKIRLSIHSKNPEVMWQIGEAQPLLGGNDDQQTLRQWGWLLAACQRGLDCDNSYWREFTCRFDQLCAIDRNAVEYLRRTAETDFPEIEALAKDINAKLDADDWVAIEDLIGITP